MSKHLVVDGQIFQTPAWHRGMGKYSVELLAALNRYPMDNEEISIDILLSSQVLSDPHMIAELKQKIPGANIVQLQLSPNDINNLKVTKHNRRIVDEYIGTVEGGNISYLILSLMQKEIYPVFPTTPIIKKFLLFYDLIPIMFPELYLANQIQKKEYLNKFKELLKADKFLAISKTAANDLARMLGVDKSRIVSIDGGPIAHSNSNQKFDVPEPFILMPTGNDYRKNNKRGVQGFNLFNQDHGNKYKLVITSFFEDEQVNYLKKISDNLIFTGNIEGDKLGYLYEHSKGLLFPAEYEGLGLPILEAVEKNKPVACSNISVFREISKDAFYYFDPYEVTDIARALTEMIHQPEVNKQKYKIITKTFTWENTAKKVLSSIPGTISSKPSNKKLAIFGPNPSSGNVMGQDLLLAHAEISREINADYYLDESQSMYEKPVNILPYVTKSVPITPGLDFNANEYDAILYYVNNGEAVSRVLFSALAIPGIVILHDIWLEDTWLQMVQQGLISESRLSFERKLDKVYGGKGAGLITSLVSRQKAVVVFSDKAKKIVEDIILKTNSKTRVVKGIPVANRSVYPEIVNDKEVSYVGAATTISAIEYTVFIIKIMKDMHG